MEKTILEKIAELQERKNELEREMKKLQLEIQQETGGALELNVYMRRLMETGLTTKWNDLKREINELEKQNNHSK